MDASGYACSRDWSAWSTTLRSVDDLPPERELLLGCRTVCSPGAWQCANPAPRPVKTGSLALGYNLFYNTGMLKLKVRAVGGSLGIILPKEALAKLKVQENDEVFLTEAPGGGYRLTPYSPEFERQMGVVEEIAKRRRNVLRELAK